jgi:hypothetical protein
VERLNVSAAKQMNSLKVGNMTIIRHQQSRNKPSSTHIANLPVTSVPQLQARCTG